MRRLCGKLGSAMLPAHSGSTRRYVRSACIDADTRMHQCGQVAAPYALCRARRAVPRCSASAAPRPPREKPSRDAYYKRAKACHPDQGGSAAEFRALATAYESALRSGDDDDTADTTPAHGFAADDPLAVYVGSSEKSAAAMRRELAEAAKLNSGGLDKGGMWWLAEQMAGEQGPPEEVSKPPPKLPRRQNARPSRKMSHRAARGLPRQRQRLGGAAARRRDSPFGCHR